MDYSLFFFADDTGGTNDGYRLLLDSARFADSAGFTAIWTPERHFDRVGGRYPNPAVTGAAIAASTHRIGIRAGSVAAPLHHPIRIAEEWSVVDNLSSGRVGVSFASGWHAADFVLRPDGFADRRRLLVETIEQVRRLWRCEELEFPDGRGEQRAMRIFPTPIQPELPVWVTSSGSPETFVTAGRLGAGVLTYLLGSDDAALAANIAAYRDTLRAEHGPSARGHVAMMVHTLLGPDRDQVLRQAREPFCRYLRGSFDLVLKGSGLLPAGVELDQLPERHRGRLISVAADRYLRTSSLIGTVADGMAVAQRLAAIGVDELACLVDFGVPADEVLVSLESLALLQQQTGPSEISLPVTPVPVTPVPVTAPSVVSPDPVEATVAPLAVR